MSKKRKKQKSQRQKNPPDYIREVAELSTVPTMRGTTANVQSRRDVEVVSPSAMRPTQRPNAPDAQTKTQSISPSVVEEPAAGLPRSQALYDTFRELCKLAHSCVLKEYCYIEDKTQMCALRDKIERLRQNGLEFDSLVAEATEKLVAEMKCINFWRDPLFTRYRTLDVLEQHRRQIDVAAATLLATEG